MFIKLSPYLIALLIGLLIGVDREQRGMKGHNAMGVRSFILFALVGAVAGGIMEPMFSLGMLIFATAITLYGYVKTSATVNAKENPLGLTSEIAGMATFALGYFAHTEPFLSLALGALILFILHNKTILHSFVRKHLRPNEIQGASVLILLAIGVVPLMPDTTIDPLHIFNPRRLAVIIVLLAAIQFGGYILSRIFGDRIGFSLSGFLAGLASSTLVFLSYPQLVKEKPANLISVATAAIFSISGSLVLLLVVVSAISWPLIWAVSIPLTTLILVCVALGAILSRRKRSSLEHSVQENPLNLLKAIKLGTLLISFIFAVELTQRFLGTTFTNLVTFLGGLVELTGVVVANANSLENQTITIEIAASAVMIAITASLVSKIAITAVVADGTYRKIMLSITVGLFLLSAGFWALLKFLPATLLK